MTPEFVQGLLAGAVILNGIGTFILASTIKNLVKEIYSRRTPPIDNPASDHNYEIKYGYPSEQSVTDAMKEKLSLVPKSESPGSPAS